MSSTTPHAHCTANRDEVLYVGVELGLTKWLLVMAPGPGDETLRREVPAGDAEKIRAAIAAARGRFHLSADAPVRSCHEAGRDGFWPHRLLTSLGVLNLVVDSSSIEMARRRKRPKTDRLDGDKLRRMLWRYWQGERKLWHVVTVPSPEREDARHASRVLTTVQQERTRYRSRLHSLLALYGARVPMTKQFPARLAVARDWAGQLLPPGVQARVMVMWRLLQAVEDERRALARAERERVKAARTAADAMAAHLCQLKGVAARTATILSEELFVRDLKNRRQVGGLLGFVAVPFDSGERRVDQGIGHNGVRAIRRIAVDLAWGWLRYQPRSALTRWYQGRWAPGGAVAHRIGIVAVARRLVIALWRYATEGTVPAGAELRAV